VASKPTHEELGQRAKELEAAETMEIRVADFTKEGEIGELLFLSPNTVKFHRYNIRTKLGLKNKKMNLRSYLLSLAK
jgi:DNA-binding CsgD family transcriptional regulator